MKKDARASKMDLIVPLYANATLLDVIISPRNLWKRVSKMAVTRTTARNFYEEPGESVIISTQIKISLITMCNVDNCVLNCMLGKSS